MSSEDVWDWSHHADTVIAAAEMAAFSAGILVLAVLGRLLSQALHCFKHFQALCGWPPLLQERVIR